MATNYTTNYDLCQWESTDQVQRTDFNADNAKLDSALAEHAAALEENSEAISAEASARVRAVASISAELEKRGNCKIYFTSYAGTGTMSHSHTFPSQPLAVLIAGPSFQLIAIVGCSEAFSMEGGNRWGTELAWDACTLTIFYGGSLGGGDSKIGNEAGSTYYLVALMDAET